MYLNEKQLKLYQDLGFKMPKVQLEYFENSDEEKELITIIKKKLIEKCKNLNKLN